MTALERGSFSRAAVLLAVLLLPMCSGLAQQDAPKKRPNVLMIVADDMNWDTPGCFGGTADGITPNIDKLASQGMRFEHAYVNISICTPSRSVLLTGLYPHNNGAEGFQQIRPGTANLPAILNEAGYLTGIVGKPLRQQELFRWSATYRWQGTGDENRWGRNPAVYGRFAKTFFTMAHTSKQPFFLMANSHDPHRPFGGGKATKPLDERAESSRRFSANDVRVPSCLPDLPGVKRELAAYATSVRRLDDMVGAVLEELAAAKLVEDTIVIFLADHGMPFPGAKFNCYPDSVRTPLIVRWPGTVKTGAVDSMHMVAAVDLQSTILEAVDLDAPSADGRSFVPLLKGERQDHREYVFAQFYHIHGRDALPMWSVISKTSAYVFNPWSDGKRRFQRLSGGAYKAMQKAAANDAKMADYIKHLQFRSVEEFFDLKSDPGCRKNLLAKGHNAGPAHAEEIVKLQTVLRQWMLRTQHPGQACFDTRNQPAALDAYMKAYIAKASKEVADLKAYEKKVGYRF